MDTKVNEIDDPKLMAVVYDLAWKTVDKLPQCAGMGLDDLTQEAWLMYPIAKSRYTGTGSATFLTFFTRVVMNRFKNIIRGSYRENIAHLPLERWDSLNKIEDRSRHISETLTLDDLLDSLTPEEKNYLAMRLEDRTRGNSFESMRKEHGISYRTELRLRNSIKAKIKKGYNHGD